MGIPAGSLIEPGSFLSLSSLSKPHRDAVNPNENKRAAVNFGTEQLMSLQSSALSSRSTSEDYSSLGRPYFVEDEPLLNGTPLSAGSRCRGGRFGQLCQARAHSLLRYDR